MEALPFPRLKRFGREDCFALREKIFCGPGVYFLFSGFTEGSASFSDHGWLPGPSSAGFFSSLKRSPLPGAGKSKRFALEKKTGPDRGKRFVLVEIEALPA